MLTYQQNEEAVYNWLYKKHKQDPEFTFSLRQKAKNGAKKDYFIGTEQSNYFAFTLWHIPVAYPGSSGDLISIVFKVRASGVKSQIEITHTNSPEEGQNQYALELINTIKDKVKKSNLNIIRESKPSQNNFRVNILPGKPSYKELDEMLDDLNKFFNKFIPIVNEAIEEVKRKHPDFEAHRITPEEFEEMHTSMLERQEKYNTVETDEGIDQTEERIYLDQLKYFIQKLGVKQGDPRIVFSRQKERYNFTIGQRWTFCYYPNHPKGSFNVISNEPLNESADPYDGEAVEAYMNHFESITDVKKYSDRILSAMKQELNRTTKSSFLKFNDSHFENAVFGKVREIKTHSALSPLNQILYGPPGTGKTYFLKEHYFEKYTSKETSLTKREHFEEVVRDLTWWQVVAIALLEKNNQSVSDLVKNDWVSYKAQVSESKNVRATIWGTLQMHTVNESDTVSYKQRSAPLIFDKNKDKTWGILEEETAEQVPELHDLLDEVNNFNPNPDKKIKRYVFTTFHQSFSYEDFIEGIKPVLSSLDNDSPMNYKIEDGVFKELCKRAESDPDNRYAIFIDEINRGNVSAIFGELITLIESDKRLGEVNEMKVKLPYSKKQFGVPSNLDIYGTMNTADRSVEALDTALRRRFSFKEMMPKPELLKDKGENESGHVGGIDLVKLLTTINDRIEVLVDRDHTIGHSYFLKVKNDKGLKNVFKDKVIPLLQEYFFGDYSKMEMVIGSYFFEKDIPKVTFAVDNDAYMDDVKRYILKDLDHDDFDIVLALEELIGETSKDTVEE